MQFIKFPNGLIWAVNEHGWISGSVLVPGYRGIENMASRLDAVAEAATGSIIGLSDFSYRSRGDDIVSFEGFAEELPNDEDDYAEEGFRNVNPNSPEFTQVLMHQYGFSATEIAHALFNLDCRWGEECVLDIHGSQRQIRTPAYPEPCSYVRIVVDGYEVAFWSETEWRDAPAEVIGAIIGAARGGR